MKNRQRAAKEPPTQPEPPTEEVTPEQPTKRPMETEKLDSATQRRSHRQRKPTAAFVESHQSALKRKRPAEGEDEDNPAQRLRVRSAKELARIGLASELLIEDKEYEIASKAMEKAGIKIPQCTQRLLTIPYTARSGRRQFVES